MRNIITLAALAMGLSTGGVAMADRFHGGGHQGGTTVVRDHRGGGDYHPNWNGGGNRVVVREHNNYRGGNYYRGGDNYYRGGWRNGYVSRRPIYVNRPIIREHYYNYYRRPAIVVENYSAMDGYFWVAGQWTWDGYEWQWYPGHYEPDPNWAY